jgi:uncharacterized protein YjbI with pentapeptide repeats
MQTINKVIPGFHTPDPIAVAIGDHEKYRTILSCGQKLKIKNADMCRMRIVSRNLDGCEMEHIDLSCCVLTGTSFKTAVLNNCNFYAAYCEGVDFSGTNLDTCSFQGAYLANVIGDGRNIHTLTTDPYIVTFTNDWIWLGTFENFNIKGFMIMDELAIQCVGVDLDWWILYRPVLEVLFCQLGIRWY